MKKILFVFLTAGMLFSGCHQTVAENTSQTVSSAADEIMTGFYTGFFLRTDSRCFFIADADTDTFYKGEPVKISPPVWDENTTVNFDSFNNGDRIRVEILQIGDTSPRDMPVYSIERIEKGTIDNIDEEIIQYLTEIGYPTTEK